jgi:hypothetical protein
VVAGDIFTITLEGIKYSYTIAAPDDNDDEALTDAIVAFLGARSPFYVYSYDDSGTFYVYIESPVYYPQISECLFFLPTASVAALAKQGGFKTGAKHPLCQFYYDKNLRRGDANISDDTSVYVPQFVEDDDVDGLNYKYTIEWEVDHLPPSWARYWRWGYAGNRLTSYFIQYIIEDFGDEDGLTYLDISPLQTLKDNINNEFPNSIIDEYVWEKGDRVRLITEENDPAGPDAIGSLLSRVFDYEIIKQDDDTNRIYIQYLASPPDVGENSLIEIYRPRKSDAVDVFYEFGPLMPIVEDSVGVSVHGGVTQDQDTDTDVPATGVLTSGDVYHIIRTPSKPLLSGSATTGVFHESMHYSDFYVSDYWDNGKVGVVSRIGEQTLNIIRESNTYIQGTQLNGLTTFEALKFKELNDIYGAIRSMREVGDTLKVYQDTKSSSILIGKQEYTDTTGRSQVVTSDRTLGSIRYPENSFGTIFPESVTKNNRYVYGWDVYNGVIWRDSPNGIFPISGRFESVDGRGSYKMESYFKEKAKALITSGVENAKVMTVWDEEYGLLYVTFIDNANADNNETIVWHEGSNRWITFADLSREDTWNEFLFPTYSVVKGFPNGLNEEYSEEDGFTYFTLNTGADSGITPTFPTLTITPLAVTITSVPDITAGLQGLTISPLAATVEISYVDVFPALYSWGAAQSGSGVAIEVTLDAPLDTTITAKPSWIVVTRYSGAVIGVGDTVEDDEILLVYPSSVNTGVLRSGNLTFTDGVGNTDSTTLSQSATTVVNVVVIAARTTEAFSVSSASGTATAGSTDVDITFTPNDSLSAPSAEFTCYYSILKNGAEAGSGSFTATNLEANNETLTMTLTASGGDGITVYLANEEIT